MAQFAIGEATREGVGWNPRCCSFHAATARIGADRFAAVAVGRQS